MIEAVMGETPPVVTMAEPAAGWAEEKQVEVEVKVEVEGSAEASSTCGGRRWKGVRVGVWLTIGARVDVGAALWARSR